MSDVEPVPAPPADHYPGVDGLDALELHASGIIPRELLDLPVDQVRVVDVEGVPVASVDRDTITWLSRRSPRPFEGLHRGPDSGDGPVVLVDAATRLAELPAEVGTIAVLASTDDPDRPGDLALVRTVRQKARAVGAAVVVVPLGLGAPRRVEKLAHVRAAYAPALDLTSDQPHDIEVPPTGGVVVLFTGLSGSGKSTLARALRDRLVEDEGRTVSLLDGDVVRRHLSAGLGFSPEDRETNVRRIGWVAAEIARHGGTAIASPIAPFDSTRREVRAMVEGHGARFVLVHVATPLEECERRDRKGLYARARAGEIPDFTGISSPYDRPTDATLTLDTTGHEVDPLVDQILATLTPASPAR